MERPQIRDFQNDDTYDMNWGRFAGAMRIYCDHLEIRLKEAEEVLNQIFNLGHNNDCIFCGLKDKEVLKGLGRER